MPKGTENNGVLIKSRLNLKKPKMLLEYGQVLFFDIVLFFISLLIVE